MHLLKSNLLSVTTIVSVSCWGWQEVSGLNGSGYRLDLSHQLMHPEPTRAYLQTRISDTIVPSLSPCDWFDIDLLLLDMKSTSRTFCFGLIGIGVTLEIQAACWLIYPCPKSVRQFKHDLLRSNRPSLSDHSRLSAHCMKNKISSTHLHAVASAASGSSPSKAPRASNPMLS